MRNLIRVLVISVLFPVSHVFAEPQPSEVVIGALFTLSGFGAVGGKDELQGMQLAQEDINKGGGINGKQLRLIVEDARSDFRATTSAYRKLTTIDKVLAVVGPNWAEFSEVIAPIADAERVPTITPSGWKKGLLAKHKYFYSLAPPHRLLARPLANAISAKGFRSVAWVVSQNSFFVSLADATAEQLGNVVTTSRSELLPDFTDFRSVLKKIQTEKPDVVVAFLQENSGLGSFVRQFKDLNIASQLMVMAISYQSDLQQLLPIVDGVPSLEVLAIGTPEFRSRFEERFKSKPLGGAAKAYDSLMVLKNAIERCGESRADLQKCLPTTDIAGVGGHVRFGPDRENADESPWMKMMMVKDGKFFELNDQLEVGAEFPF